MKRSLNLTAGRKLKMATIATLFAAICLFPQSAEAATPKSTRAKPENPIGMLLAAGAIGGTIIMLKRHKTTGGQSE